MPRFLCVSSFRATCSNNSNIGVNCMQVTARGIAHAVLCRELRLWLAAAAPTHAQGTGENTRLEEQHSADLLPQALQVSPAAAALILCTAVFCLAQLCCKYR